MSQSTVHNRELVRLLRGWTAAAEDADLSTQQARTFRRAASSLASYTEPVTTREGGRPSPPGRDAPNDTQKSFEPRNTLYTPLARDAMRSIYPFSLVLFGLMGVFIIVCAQTQTQDQQAPARTGHHYFPCIFTRPARAFVYNTHRLSVRVYMYLTSIPRSTSKRKRFMFFFFTLVCTYEFVYRYTSGI